jgi:hypothetical protein
MPTYVNPFGDTSGGQSDFSSWVGNNGQGARPSSWYDVYEGDKRFGLGALAANLVRSWRGGQPAAFTAWLNNMQPVLESQYAAAADKPGNENLNWMDWLAQRQSNIMSDYATASPVEAGYRPWDYINLRTRWQR